MNSNNKTKIGTLNLQLASTDANYKIGKINEKLNFQKCTIAKDTSKYKLNEKKSSKEEVNYTGSKMTEQTSKYLIFKVKPDGKNVEVFPADDWYLFKKDIHYTTIPAEEAEEKMKLNRQNALDIFLKNKSSAVKKEKKTKEQRDEERTYGGGGGANLNSKFVMEEDDEDRKFFNKGAEEEPSDNEADADPELKDIPSDIEEGLKGKEKGKTSNNNNFIMSSQDEESEDSFFGKKDDESDVAEDDEDDDDISQIDNDYFLGHKRSATDELEKSSSKQQRTSNMSLDESLINILTKNNKMTESQISKELARLGFTDLGNKLHSLLNRYCNKFQEGKEFYYFKKPE
jgi:hypothetical protein